MDDPQFASDFPTTVANSRGFRNSPTRCVMPFPFKGGNRSTAWASCSSCQRETVAPSGSLSARTSGMPSLSSSVGFLLRYDVITRLLGDSVQPGLRRRALRLIAAHRAPGLEKDLLRRVFDILDPSDPTGNIAVDRAEVAIVQLGKGVMLTLHRLVDQRVFRWLGRR